MENSTQQLKIAGLGVAINLTEHFTKAFKQISATRTAKHRWRIDIEDLDGGFRSQHVTVPLMNPRANYVVTTVMKLLGELGYISVHYVILPEKAIETH